MGDTGGVFVQAGRGPRRRVRRRRSQAVCPDLWRWRWTTAGRGKHRIFNTAAYWFYWGTTPPVQGMGAQATSVTLPYTTTPTFADGTWYFSASWFNGVKESPFLPLGPNGETYLRLDISGGAAVSGPPNPPGGWHLELRPAAYVAVVGFYFQAGALRADQWAAAFDTGVSIPAMDSPSLTPAMTAGGIAVIDAQLPSSFGDGVTVNVRCQTRRNDGTEGSPVWVYSEEDEVKTIVTDFTGTTAPPAGDRAVGRLTIDD